MAKEVFSSVYIALKIDSQNPPQSACRRTKIPAAHIFRQSLLWAHCRLWKINSRGLLSPLETLKNASQEAANGTKQPLVTINHRTHFILNLEIIARPLNYQLFQLRELYYGE